MIDDDSNLTIDSHLNTTDFKKESKVEASIN